MVRIDEQALTRSAQIIQGKFRTEMMTGRSSQRERCEEELFAAGVELPLAHRSEWISVGHTGSPCFIAVRNGAGRCECGFGLVVSKSRAWPGSLVVRVERFGSAVTEQARNAGIVALASLARSNQSILRVNLELFSLARSVRESAGMTAKEFGFRPQCPPRSYPNTLAIDLTPEEDVLFSSLGRRARRGIRAADKNRVAILDITDERYASRLEELRRETFARTGGHMPNESWSAIIAASQAHPKLSRIVGLFREGIYEPPGLLAFAWGRRQTGSVEYAAAASIRSEDIRIPLTFALTWDLMRWGKQVGATWFDFGGISDGSTLQSDPLKGISDFKRSFSSNVVTVGEEWVLEPRLKSHLARAASAGAGFLRRLF